MRIQLPLAVHYAAAGALLAMASAVAGQSLPPAPTVPPVPEVGPAPATTPEIRSLLTMLHDRKDTLKDFAGKIDYSVTGKDGVTTGKHGTVDYVTNPTAGPTFSADFTKRVDEDGDAKTYFTQFIFDGREFTIKDLGIDGKGRQYVRSLVLPPGAKPGSAVTLNGAMTLPIGLDVEDVLRTFEVTMGTSKDPNLAVLKLVPRVKGRFDYKQLDVTVDKKLQLPTTLAQTAPDGTVTTITLTVTDQQINSGKAKLLSAATPASEGWTERK